MHSIGAIPKLPYLVQRSDAQWWVCLSSNWIKANLNRTRWCDCDSVEERNVVGGRKSCISVPFRNWMIWTGRASKQLAHAKGMCQMEADSSVGPSRWELLKCFRWSFFKSFENTYESKAFVNIIFETSKHVNILKKINAISNLNLVVCESVTIC